MFSLQFVGIGKVYITLHLNKSSFFPREMEQNTIDTHFGSDYSECIGLANHQMIKINVFSLRPLKLIKK